MKNNKQWLWSFVSGLAIAGISIGTMSFAQTITPLTCSVASGTVISNQAVILTAAGGNGTFAWAGPNLSVTNSAGTQFAVSYPTPGVYPIVVSSGGLTATCNVVVTAAPSTGILNCIPAVQNVTLGQTASVTVSGGDGTYVWSSPDITVNNPTGSGFSANYGTSGLKTLTVKSAGLTETCAINVLSGVAIPVTTPGLPNTGYQN